MRALPLLIVGVLVLGAVTSLPPAALSSPASTATSAVRQLGASTPANGSSSGPAGALGLGVDGGAAAYDPDNGFLYVANPGNDTVLVVNGSSRQLAAPPIALNLSPGPIAYDPANGCLYVATPYGLEVIQATTDRVIAPNLTVGAELPYALAVDPNPDRIVVSDAGAGDLWLVNGSNQSVVGPPLSVPGAGPVAYDPVTGRVYVGILQPFAPRPNSTQSVVIVDPANDTVVNSTLGPADYANDIAYDPANGELYLTGTTAVTNPANNTTTESSAILAIDPVSRRYTTIPDGAYSTESIVAAPSARLLYVGIDNGFSLLALNSTTNEIEPSMINIGGDYAFDGFPIGDLATREPAAFDAATGWLYVTDVDCQTSMANGQTYCEEPIIAVHEDRLYQALAREQGLPSGTSWTVSVWVSQDQGEEGIGTTTGTELPFALWNGTYYYSASAVAAYTVVVENGSSAGYGYGSFAVAGPGAVFTTRYVTSQTPVGPTEIVLTELGLRTGSLWTVVATGGPNDNSTTASANGSSLVMELASGGYTIEAGSPGYVAASGPFHLTVTAQASNTTVLFVAAPTTGPPPHGPLASLPWLWLGLGVLIGGAAVGAVAAYHLRRRAPPSA